MSNIHHLERSLRKLRLTRVGAEWHALEKRALAEGWTPSRYLLTLCNEELLWRESEKLRRYKKEARLPVAKTLSEYDSSQVPELNGAQFRQLCETTDWVDAGENVLLLQAQQMQLQTQLEELNLYRRKMFGRSAEPHPPQGEVFNEVEAEAPAPADVDTPTDDDAC